MSLALKAIGVTAGVSLALGAPGPRPAGPAGQQAQFRSSIDLVQIDVSVVDDNRRPVRGLTVDDFRLLEDGVEQSIANFAFVDTPTREWTESVWPDDVVTNVPSGRVGDGRLMVLLMDNVNTFDPRAHGTAVSVGRSIVAQMGPQDLAAVVFTSNATAGQDFTNDRARLLRAVESFNYQLGTNPMSRMVQLTRDMAQIPDRRKMIFYIGPGYNFSAELLGPAQETYGDVQGQMAQLVLMMQDVFRTARLANVAIYSFDPLGLGPVTEGLAIDRRRNYKDFLRIVASETGGRAVVNLNEPSREVPRVFRENNSYYLLGFQSSNPEIDGKYRRIRVEVNRRDVDVRARSGYFALGPERLRSGANNPRARAEREMALRLADPDLPMSLAVVPIARNRRDDPSLAVAVRFDPPTPRQATRETVDLTFSLFDANGRPSESSEREVSVTLQPGTAPYASYQALWAVDVDPGRYQIAVSAEAREREASGSVVASVTVPDFEDENLSLSGVALVGGPTLPSVPESALAGLLPAVPTTTRIFDATDTVTAFARVFRRDRRGGPVALTARILGEADAVAAETTSSLPPDAFAEGDAADYRYALPLAELPAGAYTLVIDAQMGERRSERRLLFTIR